MTKQQAEAAMKRCEAATPEPWSLVRVPIQSCGGSNTAYKIGPFNACLYDDWKAREAGISEKENEANAALMHASRVDIPAALTDRAALIEALKPFAAGLITVRECLEASERAIALLRSMGELE